MRIFEIVILLLSTILPIYLSIKSLQIDKRIVIIIVTATVILHLILEGLRWQMTPAYLILLISFWCIYKEYRFFKGGWFRKGMSGLVFILLLLFGWVLPYILPVFTLPSPTGKHPIGSQYIHLESMMPEVITAEYEDRRELMIKVWYPATVGNEQTEKYLNDGDRLGFAHKYGLPSSTFSYLDYVKTHTYASPAVASGKFPVLIFSPGIYSNASGYYALIEEIVSHGYIVMNINHTYESTGALFPDGTIKLYHQAYDREKNNQKMAEMAWEGTQNYHQATTPEEEFSAVENLIREYFGAEITYRWRKDISLTIDQLSQWNKSSFLTNHIAVEKIGVLGHSQGGSAAGQALLEDQRITAGVNIDGVQWGNMVDTLMTKPFALLSSDWDASHPDLNRHIYRNGSTSTFYKAKIAKSGHSNFMDIPLMIKIPVLNEAGAIDENLGYELTSKFILNFFDNHLLNQPTDVLTLKQKHPELEIELTE